MAPKRPLGLGKAAKAKKQKSDSAEPEPADNQLTVELGEEVDANDAIAQLTALWKNFIKSTDRSELMLNGIVHECDRILRKAHNRGAEDDGEKIELSGEFYGIYGLALSSLGFFHTEEPAKVEEFFQEATDRIESGKKVFPDSVSLLFAEARIHINNIPLSSISHLNMDSKVSKENREVGRLLDDCLAIWERAVQLSEEREQYKYYNLENSDFLKALDDLLDMVDNFGRDKAEGQDSDAEDDDEAFVVGPNHPLYAIGETDKYNLWWREHTERFLANLNRKIAQEKVDTANASDVNVSLRRELSKRLGQSLLMEAETPSNIFTTLTYYKKDQKSLDGMTREEARQISQDLLLRALEYLKAAQDDEEPDSWAAVAEAMISLGNTYDLDSEEQEKTYEEAEAILKRANNATNGRYEKILENLQG